MASYSLGEVVGYSITRGNLGMAISKTFTHLKLSKGCKENTLDTFLVELIL